MRPLIAAATLGLLSAAAQAQTTPASAIQAAIANPARPAADRAADAARKPADMLAFSGLKSGDSVVDMLSGGGYFTQLFCGVVGPAGHIYQLGFNNIHPPAPPAGAPPRPPRTPAPAPICANVTKLSEPDNAITLPAPVDVVWTSRNYHDLHNTMFGKPDMTAFNKSIYAALKPGGIYIVLDYVAAPGTGTSVTETLHRIDPAQVKQEVTSAGFKYVGDIDVLRNTTDDHTQRIFTMHAPVDQFVMKFQRPN